jgi:hypothetical protein
MTALAIASHCAQVVIPSKQTRRPVSQSQRRLPDTTTQILAILKLRVDTKLPAPHIAANISAVLCTTTLRTLA